MVKPYALWVVVLAAGCVQPIENENLHLAKIERDCVVQAGEAQVGAPVSLEFGDRSFWIWDQISVPDPGGGTREITNAGASVYDVASACSGALDFALDPDGAPATLLKLSAGEEAENAARTDGRRLGLQILGGFTSGDRGTLYYQKLLVGPGIFDAEPVGVGVCVMEAPGLECVRLEPGVVEGEPTLLWRTSNSTFNLSGTVLDGYAYLYDCFNAAAMTDLCILFRVEPDRVGDPEAYRSYNWMQADPWIPEPSNATVISEISGPHTVRANPFLGGFQMVAADIWSASFSLSTADQPWGNFKKQGTLLQAVPPKDWFIQGGREHATLGSPDGQQLVVSYTTDPDGQGARLHLVTLRLDHPAK